MNEIENLAYLKHQIVVLEEEYKERSDRMLEHFLAEGIDNQHTKYGTLYIVKKKQVELPEAITQEVKNLNLRKAKIRKDLVLAGKYSVNPELHFRTKEQEEKLTVNKKGTLHV